MWFDDDALRCLRFALGQFVNFPSLPTQCGRRRWYRVQGGRGDERERAMGLFDM